MDDEALEKYHRDAAEGRLRQKRRTRGLGLDDDGDDEDENEDDVNRRIRLRMNKKRRIDADTLDELGEHACLCMNYLASDGLK